MSRHQETLTSDGQIYLPFGYELFDRQAVLEPLSTAKSSSLGNLRANVLATREQSPEGAKRINFLFDYNDHQSYLDSKPDVSEYEQFGKLTDWLIGTSDESLARFALWNVLRTGKLIKALERDKLELDDHALSKVEELAEDGLLPLVAADVYLQKARVSDNFRPIDSIKSGAYGVEASYRPASDQISLSNMYADRGQMRIITPAMHAVVLHEKTHSLTPEDETYSRSGLPLWLNEACASHLQYSSLFGQADVANPLLREHDANEPGYRSERHLMAQLFAGSGVALDGLYHAIITKNELQIEDINVLIEDYFDKIVPHNVLRYRQFQESYSQRSDYRRRVELVNKAIAHLVPDDKINYDQPESGPRRVPSEID